MTKPVATNDWTPATMPVSTRAITARTLLNMSTKEPAPTETLPDDSVTGKAQAAFKSIIAKFTASDMDVTKAKEGYTAEVDRHGSAKVALLTGLAEIAEKQNWSHKYALQGIEAAIAEYEKGRNGLRASSLRQFATECGRAIHPEARKHLKADFAKVERLWKAEGDRIAEARQEAKDNKTKYEAPETPLRDAFKRQYHAVIGSTGVAATRIGDEKAKVAGDAELAASPLDLADAVISDDKRDTKRAGQALAKACTVIREVAEEFPDKRFETVLKFLESMDKAELGKLAKRAAKAARKSDPDDVNAALDAMLPDSE